MSIILFVLSLGVLIFIHELGHFLTAKAFKVYVKEFALGFGPLIFKVKKGETQYSLRALPLGGYVGMYGEEAGTADPDIPYERSILGVKKWKRAIVMSAGIVLNLVLAYVLFFVANFAFDQRTLTNIIQIAPGSPLEALILPDEVLYFQPLIDGNTPVVISTTGGEQTYYVKFSNFNTYEDELIDIIYFSRTEAGEVITYTPTALTDTASFEVTIKTFTTSDEFTTRQVTLNITAIAAGEGFVWAETGLGFYVDVYRYTFWESLGQAGIELWDGATLVAKTLAGLFMGQGLNEVGGVVAIFSASASVLENLGMGPYIYLWGLISVNLAVFNLLPFPGLDGWHLLIITIESISRKEIPSKVKNTISAVGVLILLGLMLLLLLKDIIALF